MVRDVDRHMRAVFQTVVVAVVASTSCTSKSSDPTDETASDASSTTSTDTTESDTLPADEEGTTGEPACEGHLDASMCESQLGCAWLEVVPTTLDAEGACVYGETEARCLTVQFQEDGCGIFGECVGEANAFYQQEGDQVVITTQNPLLCDGPTGWDACSVSNGDGDGDPSILPPECACVCEDDWPG